MPSSHLAGELGAILTRARGGRSLRAMARDLDMAHSSLAAVEAGTDNPTLSRVEDLADAYGVRVRLVVDEPAP